MSMDKQSATRQVRELIIERMIDAPREIVFKAWTEPHQVMRWWAPPGFVATFCAMDMRPGGQWRVCMQSPDGVEHWTHGVYNAVCEPEMLLLSLTWQAAAESPALESVISLRFADEGQKTRLTFEQTIFEMR
jgi:uncharacterized protein YndB with AHSA1/START domain